MGKTKKFDIWSWESKILAPPVAKMFKDIRFVIAIPFYTCNYEGLQKYQVPASKYHQKRISSIFEMSYF